MKSRVFSIPFGVFALIMCVCYPIFAQVGGGRASGGPQSIASPPAQALPPSAPVAPDVAPSGSQIQIPFKKNETNTQQSTGQKQGLQGQAQQQGKQNSDPAENVARSPVAGYGTNFSQPSPIEAAFQDLLKTRTPSTSGPQLQSLWQFGYAIFGLPVSTFAPIDDVPIGSEYVLGPGDELRIIVWGAMENTYSQTVDHYGRIYLPTVGPIRVWGLTFSQAEKLILSYLSQYYKGFQSSVTMGHLRTIKIYVMGEVNQPGSYNISALSSLTNALVAAGGPSTLGTLRSIQLKRNNQTIEEFDFYDFLLSGDKSKDCRLEAGDIIFVPPIGNVVGIAGEVKRPAIYEFKETLRIKDLIAMAGGLTVQSYLNRVQIIRSKPSAEREAIDIDLSKAMGKEGVSSNIELQNGDLVTIFPSDPRIYNTVSVNGLVKHPGDYEYKPGMRISQLLSAQTILPNAYLDSVEIVRFKEDLSTQVIHVNLKKAWSGDITQDIDIMTRDQIIVRSDFKASESVTLAGEFKLPGSYTIQPGDRLSAVIKRAGGFTDKSYLKGAVFIRRSVAERERERLDAFMKELEEKILSETKTVFVSHEQAKALYDQEANQRRQQLQVIASKVVLGRIIIDLDSLTGSEDDLILEEGDSLTVQRQPADVLVLGSVRNPSSIVHKKNKEPQYYIDRTGGFSKNSDKKEVYLLRVDGSALSDISKLKEVDPGDTIIVPPKVKTRDYSWIAQIATISSQSLLSLASLMVIAQY